jgi:DNA-binding response OmpR family regulator
MPGKKTVLLVGSDAFLLPLYARNFREAGFAVQLASAEAALGGAFEAHAPDLVLYDAPEGEAGVAFLRKARKQTAAAAPILCLSHDWSKTHRARLLRAGADSHFIKSCTMPGEIIEHAERLLA